MLERIHIMYRNYIRLITFIDLKFAKATFLNRNLSYSSSPLFNSNSRITRYFKEGDVQAARKLFDELPHRNVVTWNCMISGYIRNGMIQQAQELFDSMPSRNVVSWTAMLSGYARNGKLEEAKMLFDSVGDKNLVCWNSMISGYVSNGRIAEGRALFDTMPARNSTSWAIMIEGYFQYGDVIEAEKLFNEVAEKSVSVYNVMLAGYAERGNVEDSFQLFVKMGTRDIASWTSMISCLLRAGKVVKARRLFDDMPEKDIVAWTTMMKGYLDNNQIQEAQELFDKMPSRDIVAWNSMISGYAQNGNLQEALDLFRKMPKRDVVSWNLILLAYVQQGDLKAANRFFEEMPRKDETSWNTMISGFQNEAVLFYYLHMLRNGLKPNQGTFPSVISMCGLLALQGCGRAVHASVIKSGLENDIMILSSLISMYSRCGFIDDATCVFHKMKNRDTAAWNAMIVAQAYHGSATEALNLFHSMLQDGFEPDHITFMGLLAACAHSGMVDKGWEYFNSMQKTFHVIPKPEHYACMVDLLARSGLLSEAFEFVKRLPAHFPTYARETLVSSCRVHDSFKLGDFVAKEFQTLICPSTVGMSVLLSNTYASRGMWESVAEIRINLRQRQLRKELACSWIEVNGCFSQFVYNDKSHPQAGEIYTELESLSVLIENVDAVMY
ncbi:PREDICTED: pentatricopeptide repeat-containing protein At4g02750-like [Ipomoea nil]|uniref:pentatricopeptide repeat-containing protein At4g02750-like n=1 Tax=Ipomoea nil TaxID=35883 RepID=UPI000901C848|nr:PREDICTED: pentatricopeptide repeat-containing protein At4g02750-like [Ipomoea nil]